MRQNGAGGSSTLKIRGLYGHVYRELAQGVKSTLRSPVFASVFILALATGIGPVISVFSVIDGLVLRTLPLPHPEQLVNISGGYRPSSLFRFLLFADLAFNVASKGIEIEVYCLQIL